MILSACNHETKEQSALVKRNNEFSNLDGYWIMSEYIDSIMEYKNLYKPRHKMLSWTSMLLHISNDSLQCHGIIIQQSRNQKKTTLNSDSVILINWTGNYHLTYNQNLDIINAKAFKTVQNGLDSIEYNYRRLRKTENRLVAGIDGKHSWGKLNMNFRSFFMDSLIAGNYREIQIKNRNTIFSMDNLGNVKGFKNYQQYSIATNFGTLHPFADQNAIIFEDTTIKPIRNEPPEDHGVYSWKFIGDTLKLTKMLTKSYESYTKGHESYYFVKIE